MQMVCIIVVRLVVLAAATAAGFALGPPLGLSDRQPLARRRRPPGRRARRPARVAGAARARGPARSGARRAAMLGVAFGLGLGSALGAIVPGAGALGRGLFALLLAYLGATVTLAKRDELEAMSEKLFPGAVGDRQEGDKILDTSVIIDGRIVSVCESGFLEGTLVVPAVRAARAAADRRLRRRAPAQPRPSAASTCCSGCSACAKVERAHRDARLPAGARGGSASCSSWRGRRVARSSPTTTP